MAGYPTFSRAGSLSGDWSLPSAVIPRLPSFRTLRPSGFAAPSIPQFEPDVPFSLQPLPLLEDQPLVSQQAVQAGVDEARRVIGESGADEATGIMPWIGASLSSLVDTVKNVGEGFGEAASGQWGDALKAFIRAGLTVPVALTKPLSDMTGLSDVLRRTLAPTTTIGTGRNINPVGSNITWDDISSELTGVQRAGDDVSVFNSAYWNQDGGKLALQLGGGVAEALLDPLNWLLPIGAAGKSGKFLTASRNVASAIPRAAVEKAARETPEIASLIGSGLLRRADMGNETAMRIGLGQMGLDQPGIDRALMSFSRARDVAATELQGLPVAQQGAALRSFLAPDDPALRALTTAEELAPQIGATSLSLRPTMAQQFEAGQRTLFAGPWGKAWKAIPGAKTLEPKVFEGLTNANRFFGAGSSVFKDADQTLRQFNLGKVSAEEAAEKLSQLGDVSNLLTPAQVKDTFLRRLTRIGIGATLGGVLGEEPGALLGALGGLAITPGFGRRSIGRAFRQTFLQDPDTAAIESVRLRMSQFRAQAGVVKEAAEAEIAKVSDVLRRASELGNFDEQRFKAHAIAEVESQMLRDAANAGDADAIQNRAEILKNLYRMRADAIDGGANDAHLERIDAHIQRLQSEGASDPMEDLIREYAKNLGEAEKMLLDYGKFGRAGSRELDDPLGYFSHGVWSDEFLEIYHNPDNAALRRNMAVWLPEAARTTRGRTFVEAEEALRRKISKSGLLPDDIPLFERDPAKSLAKQADTLRDRIFRATTLDAIVKIHLNDEIRDAAEATAGVIAREMAERVEEAGPLTQAGLGRPTIPPGLAERAEALRTKLQNTALNDVDQEDVRVVIDALTSRFPPGQAQPTATMPPNAVGPWMPGGSGPRFGVGQGATTRPSESEVLARARRLLAAVEASPEPEEFDQVAASFRTAGLVGKDVDRAVASANRAAERMAEWGAPKQLVDDTKRVAQALSEGRATAEVLAPLEQWLSFAETLKADKGIRQDVVRFMASMSGVAKHGTEGFTGPLRPSKKAFALAKSLRSRLDSLPLPPSISKDKIRATLDAVLGVEDALRENQQAIKDTVARIAKLREEIPQGVAERVAARAEREEMRKGIRPLAKSLTAAQAEQAELEGLKKANNLVDLEKKIESLDAIVAREMEQANVVKTYWAMVLDAIALQTGKQAERTGELAATADQLQQDASRVLDEWAEARGRSRPGAPASQEATAEMQSGTRFAPSPEEVRAAGELFRPEGQMTELGSLADTEAGRKLAEEWRFADDAGPLADLSTIPDGALDDIVDRHAGSVVAEGAVRVPLEDAAEVARSAFFGAGRERILPGGAVVTDSPSPPGWTPDNVKALKSLIKQGAEAYREHLRAKTLAAAADLALDPRATNEFVVAVMDRLAHVAKREIRSDYGQMVTTLVGEYDIDAALELVSRFRSGPIGALRERLQTMTALAPEEIDKAFPEIERLAAAVSAIPPQKGEMEIVRAREVLGRLGERPDFDTLTAEFADANRYSRGELGELRRDVVVAAERAQFREGILEEANRAADSIESVAETDAMLSEKLGKTASKIERIERKLKPERAKLNTQTEHHANMVKWVEDLRAERQTRRAQYSALIRGRRQIGMKPTELAGMASVRQIQRPPMPRQVPALRDRMQQSPVSGQAVEQAVDPYAAVSNAAAKDELRNLANEVISLIEGGGPRPSGEALDSFEGLAAFVASRFPDAEAKDLTRLVSEVSEAMSLNPNQALDAVSKVKALKPATVRYLKRAVWPKEAKIAGMDEAQVAALSDELRDVGKALNLGDDAVPMDRLPRLSSGAVPVEDGPVNPQDLGGRFNRVARALADSTPEGQKPNLGTVRDQIETPGLADDLERVAGEMIDQRAARAEQNQAIRDDLEAVYGTSFDEALRLGVRDTRFVLRGGKKAMDALWRYNESLLASGGGAGRRVVKPENVGPNATLIKEINERSKSVASASELLKAAKANVKGRGKVVLAGVSDADDDAVARAQAEYDKANADLAKILDSLGNVQGVEKLVSQLDDAGRIAWTRRELERRGFRLNPGEESGLDLFTAFGGSAAVPHDLESLLQYGLTRIPSETISDFRRLNELPKAHGKIMQTFQRITSLFRRSLLATVTSIENDVAGNAITYTGLGGYGWGDLRAAAGAYLRHSDDHEEMVVKGLRRLAGASGEKVVGSYPSGGPTFGTAYGAMSEREFIQGARARGAVDIASQATVRDAPDLAPLVPVVGKGLTKIGDQAYALREINDNVFRLAVIRAELRKGASWEDAISRARMLFFDYADVTKFEREKARTMITFYTWPRKALPLLLRSMVERPFRFKALQLMTGLGANNDDEDLPNWAKRQAGQMLGKGEDGVPRMLTFPGSLSNSAADLLEDNVFENVLRAINPVARIGAEVATDRDLFTGLPIGFREENRVKALSGMGADRAPSWMNLLPQSWKDAIGFTRKTNREGEVIAYEMDPRLRWVFETALPFSGVSRDADRAAQVLAQADERKSRLAGATVGFRVNAIPQAEKSQADVAKVRRARDLLTAELLKLPGKPLVIVNGTVSPNRNSETGRAIGKALDLAEFEARKRADREGIRGERRTMMIEETKQAVLAGVYPSYAAMRETLQKLADTYDWYMKPERFLSRQKRQAAQEPSAFSNLPLSKLAPAGSGP